MNGGSDKDSLEGGTGSDLLIGGSEADQFRFDIGAESAVLAFDEIADFENGIDKILLVGFSASNSIFFGDANLALPGFGLSGAIIQIDETYIYLAGFNVG